MKVQYFILFLVIVVSNRANAQIGDLIGGVGINHLYFISLV